MKWQSVTPKSRQALHGKRLVANSTPRTLGRRRETDRTRKQSFPGTPARLQAQHARYIASLSPNSSDKRGQTRRLAATRRRIIQQANSTIEKAGNKF